MQELPKTYAPAAAEQKWYPFWLEKGLFKSIPDEREPYTVVIPPPNVTGVLHMGHMLNNTVQDVLVRRARMQGKNACWVPGTDHASIATEARVVKTLAEQGIHKADLTREQFLEHAYAWKTKYGGIILEQLKRLGCSCDWDRTAFTMDPHMNEAVIGVFIDLFNKGLIYRGVRMVNWDPVGRTALSDEEVIYKEEQSTLYYARYRFADAPNEYITVATTRPETILADVAIAVHPADERYAPWVGRQVHVPLAQDGRTIPIITDENILIDFGTGALKVTPAHDMLDYAIGAKHNLRVIDLLNEDGTLNAHAEGYAGLDRFAARKQFAADMEAAGLLDRAEPYQNKTGRSERTDAVIEPRLSMQWFVQMGELAKPALEAVMSDEVQLHPAKFKNTYRHWMENVRDWCISRQLWWGQRIPAWYNSKGELVAVARTAAEAAVEYESRTTNTVSAADLRQDEDVLDTWFSSWLWPISVFDAEYLHTPSARKPNADLAYYYPTNDLVTAPEILFFWVARMVMAGQEWLGKAPFKNVYLTGIVRDKQGRKMSKSLGNSPDALGLIDQYGADGVRVGMLLTSPAGNDLLFDESLCEQGRNFTNKIWNALRLVKGWEGNLENSEANLTEAAPYDPAPAQWMRARTHAAIAEMDAHYDKFRLSDALMSVYKLIWDDFCSSYLEMVKPAYGTQIRADALNDTLDVFDVLMRLVHPFTPFLSEEVWQALRTRKEAESVCIAPYPIAPGNADETTILEAGERALALVAAIRHVRGQKNIPARELLHIQIGSANDAEFAAMQPTIAKLAGLETITYGTEAPRGWSQLMLGNTRVWVNTTAYVDVEAERTRMAKDLDYQRGFLASVMKKVGNEKFMAGAPEAVRANELAKRDDALSKIKALEEALGNL